MSDETTLRECPFCGGEAHVVSDYSSEHNETLWKLWHKCNGHEGKSKGYGYSLHPLFETPWYKTKAEAIAAWNTRVELGSRTCAQCAKDMGAYADSLCDPLKEQMDKLIRCLENDYGIKTSWDGLRKVWLTEAIEPRDGTAAALGRGEREWREVVVGGRTEGYECECGHMMPEVPRFCPNCGWKAVKR